MAYRTEKQKAAHRRALERIRRLAEHEARIEILEEKQREIEAWRREVEERLVALECVFFGRSR